MSAFHLAGVYDTTTQFVDEEQKEQDAWAQLRGLESWSGPLGPEGRVYFVSALQAARLELWETGTIAKIAFGRAKALGMADPQARVMTEGTGMPHAVCLPINTTRERALRLLNGKKRN